MPIRAEFRRVPGIRSAIIVLILLGSTVDDVPVATGAELFAGGQLGYSGAPGGQLYVQMSDFAADLPLDLRLGLQYLARDAGHPGDARRVFINDATNGVPEESGRLWAYRLDFVLPLDVLSIPNFSAYGGPRYGRFTSNFRFVGGNEDFDVISHQWGVGLGGASRFPMSAHSNFVLEAGFDWYFESTLQGHDTSYAPDGDDVNPRNDYDYQDADAAINQPSFDLRFAMGVDFRFGG